jgi:hypothetical protein
MGVRNRKASRSGIERWQSGVGERERERRRRKRKRRRRRKKRSSQLNA